MVLTVVVHVGNGNENGGAWWRMSVVVINDVN